MQKPGAFLDLLTNVTAKAELGATKISPATLKTHSREARWGRGQQARSGSRTTDNHKRLKIKSNGEWSILFWSRELQRNLVVIRKFISVLLDIDECANAIRPDCDANAVCNNTQGSYVCACKEGFYKDGQNCTSNYKIQLFSVELSRKQYFQRCN